MMTSMTSAGCWRTVTSIARRIGRGLVHNEYDAVRRELNVHLRDAPSVRAAATAALEQGPKEFVYVRVKEGPNEFIPHRGLVSESFTTHLDIAESALRSPSAEDGGGCIPTQ